VELELAYDVVRSQNFTYNTGIVGSYNGNRFVSFSNETYANQGYQDGSGFPAPGSPGYVQRTIEGERVGTYWTYKYAGVDDTGNWMVYNKDGEKVPFRQANEADKGNMGNGMPKYTLSWSNSLKYKNFDMTLFFRGQFGYQVYDIHTFYWGLQSAASNTNVLKSAYKENAHIVTGSNTHNSYFIRSGSHLKLDVVTLGYTINTRTSWLDNIRVYATARNLYTLTGWKGVDLDIFPTTGMEPGVPANKKNYYPSAYQLQFGVQVNF
jgi:hypothetical protein